MDIIDKLFNDLESNNLLRVEDSKKRLSEFFAQTKESWLVNGMMEYFSHTNSSRIVDILVKVQAPHDKFIFDRLAEWIHSPHRNQAITLFGHIVKKHPSWLHKVAAHPLFRDILKLLKTETNIIITMNALFCIITLLPIIPTSMPQYLADLFEVFLNLATWNCQNQPRLTDDQLIHLQIGLSTFFQRLYGMFPCNFIWYLSDSVSNEHTTVFAHTIRPLLETVKMHPMLLTSNRDQEKNNTRWKEMEPHDVVFECSRFSLDYPTGSLGATDNLGLISECPYYKIISRHSATATPVSQQLRIVDRNPPIAPNHLSSQFFSPFDDANRGAKEQPQRIDNLWSPLMGVMATPPPISSGTNAPATPTPFVTSYPVPALSASNPSGQQQLCNSGSSPPETAVEATPETTPVPRADTARVFPAHSTAVRAIWGHSQPSSPLKKDVNPNFRFSADVTAAEVPSITSPKIMSFVTERSLYAHQMFQSNNTSTNHGGGRQMMVNAIPSVAVTDSAQEDAEVNQINSAVFPPILVEHSSFQNYTPHVDPDRPSVDDDSHTMGEVTKDANNLAYVPTVKPNKRQPKAGSGRSNDDDDEEDDEDTADDDDDVDDNDVDDDSAVAPEALPRNDSLKSKLLRSKRSNFAHHNDHHITVGTQTLEQLPQSYRQIFVDLLDMAEATKSRTESESAVVPTTTPTSPPTIDAGSALGVPNNTNKWTVLSPHALLDLYIDTSVKKRDASSGDAANHRLDDYRDQIQMLIIHLQFERNRREVHADRNRRLLGKSRVNASLEMDNETLREQTNKLVYDVEELNKMLNKARMARTQQEQKYERECVRFQREMQAEQEEKKSLKEKIEALQRGLLAEQRGRKDLTAELEAVRAEMFDMRNELSQTQERADMGVHYKDELVKLQTEFILMGEIQIRCKDKLNELDSNRARGEEADLARAAYLEEVREMKYALESKSSQLDSSKTRMQELEAQLSKRDTMFIDQKRLLKTVKEEYQDRFRSLEEKYKVQKAVILRLEEELLEMFHKSQSTNALNTHSSSSETDKTNDHMIGSLDHTSPLSISLASSEGLSISLRSTTTEIRNLLPLVTAGAEGVAGKAATDAGQAGPSSSSGNRQPVSEDIPVPSSTSQTHHHLHSHQKHNHL